MKKIYYNGTILTMEDKNPLAESLLISNGTIEYVGNYSDLPYTNEIHEKIDLKGHTLMPSFIDCHSHFSAVANSFLQVSLDGCISFEEIQIRIREFIKNRAIEPGKWINAKGYDHNILREKAHPDKKILDDCSRENPIVIQHTSGHFGVFNSLGLRELGIDKSTIAPFGGRIGIVEGDLNGYMEENAFIEYLKLVPMPSIEELIDGYRRAQKYYASFGITTIQEGLMVKEMIPFYKHIIDNKLLDLDLVAYCDVDDSEVIFKTFKENVKKYKDRFKIGGYKIFLDGSPQGRTAWMREAYEGHGENYYGYPSKSDEEVLSYLERAVNNNQQILAHCNGDRAIQQYIESIEKVAASKPINHIRPVIVHSQFIGEDQLDMVKKLNLIPSFFLAHVYYWGDIHLENFGRARASMISPLKSALDRKIKFNLHQDSPVIAPDMFESIWCAVNRRTKKGEILGGNQCIGVMDALKAVTINAAYQYFEEDTKGSLEVGKIADMIIVDKNPLKVDKEEIKNIRILETIKNGEHIFKKV